MRIHEGWFRSTEKAAKPEDAALPPSPRACSFCGSDFIPANGAQVFCTAPNCKRDRATKRQQERRQLQQMMADAERKKKQYDGMAKAQITAVKRAFRETEENDES